MNDTIKVAIIDEGIEAEIEEFKDFKIIQNHKISEELKKTVRAFHGTAVFNVFTQTFQHYIKNFVAKPVNVKEAIEIIDFCIFNEKNVKITQEFNSAESRPSLEDTTRYMQSCFEEVIDSFNKSCRYFKTNTNMSFSFGLAEYNIAPLFTDVLKKYYDHSFMAVAAGNEDEITTNDTVPANNPYVCVVGATVIPGEERMQIK